MSQPENPIPLEFTRYSEDEMLSRATEFYRLMKRRRSVRDFTSETVSHAIIEQCLLTAGTAASGANCQPWRFPTAIWF